MRTRSLFAATALATPFLLGAAASSALDKDVVLTFSDPDIVESSGLVVADDLAVTVNDSGDSARIFVVDLATGDTLGTVTYEGEGRDVEALAPADEGNVWVGDIGDNLQGQDHVEVHRVPIAQADSSVEGESFDLAYPGEPQDAEALLAHPKTGRLYVVSKSVLGGSLYAAPKQLDPSATNQLEEIGSDLPGLVTDGAFFPDGEHLIVRNYSQAFVLEFPSLREVGQFSLPAQEQGEGVAVGTDGLVYLSSEGVDSELLRVELPLDIRKALDPTATYEEETDSSSNAEDSEDSGSSQDSGSEQEPDDDTASGTEPDPWPWVIGGVFGIVALVVLVRSLKPR